MDEPVSEELAKKRFFLITACRMGGVVMVLLGIAMANGAVPGGEIAAYVLALLGVIELFLIPQVLIRMWSTNKRR